MPNRNELTALGLGFAGITAAVMAVAGWVVSAHLTGELSLEGTQIVSEMSTNSVRQ